jgi:short-subunit dehydrogenase
MQRLKGRVAAITGAGSGIGKALARELAARGCHLALSDIDTALLAETARDLSGTGVAISTHEVDVARREHMEAYAEAVMARHGGVQLLFNNAGVALVERAEHIPLEDFHWLMDINFWGVVHGCQVFLPLLRAADEGHIVNISSMFGLIGVPTQAAYNAAKFAVRGYTEALQQELEGSSVRASVVCPGGIRTQIAARARMPDRSGTIPGRSQLTQSFERMARTSAERAAQLIVGGVLKDRRRILVGPDARLVGLIVRLLPVRYPALIKRMMPAEGINV